MERPEGKEHIMVTINIMWQIWKSKNQIQFSGERKCPGLTINKAKCEWIEHQKTQLEGEGEIFVSVIFPLLEGKATMSVTCWLSMP